MIAVQDIGLMILLKESALQSRRNRDFSGSGRAGKADNTADVAIPFFALGCGYLAFSPEGIGTSV